MIIGTIILDCKGHYIDAEGNLPSRPSWDKAWLHTMVACNTVTKGGLAILPPSMVSIAKVTAFEPTLAITIPEIATLSEVLFVTRTPQMCTGVGKTFRLDAFELITKQGLLEVYKRKEL